MLSKDEFMQYFDEFIKVAKELNYFTANSKYFMSDEEHNRLKRLDENVKRYKKHLASQLLMSDADNIRYELLESLDK